MEEVSKQRSWLQSLKSVLTNIIGSNVDIADELEKLWQKEEEAMTQFAREEPTLFENLDNSSEEFGFMISRLFLPRIIEKFQVAVNLLKEKHPERPVPPVGADYDAVLEYCHKTTDPFHDSVALLCSLGDYVGRVRHTTDADRKQISKIKHREEKVFAKLSKKEELRSAKLKYLKGEDETKLVSTAYDNLHSSLDTTRNDLDVAIQEEEEARKAYERAMAKTKLLRDKVAKMETAASALENQRSMLLAVNEKSVKIDAVAKSVSWGRVNLLTSLQQTMEIVWLQRVKDLVTSYTSESFHTAWNQYTVGLNGISGDPENVLKIRLGQEILTLWRKQLDTDSPVYLLVDDAFHQLSTQAQAGQSLPTLQVYPNKTSTSTTNNRHTATEEGKEEDYTSSTVVLYNTLNYHETPTDHVESQARTQTAAKLILQRFHQQQNIQEDERQRSLALRESNDITAVPMYCLPLVHSPQYLNRLYTFAKEAEQEDLYVPLEFDTEWETDIGYSSSGSEDLSEDELFTGRLSRWAKLRKVDEALLRPALESHLSTDHIRQLVKVINPTRQEFRLASVLSKQAANHPHHLDDRDDDDDGDGDGDDHDESPRRLSPNRKYAIGRRVQTTYGDGLIINDHPSRPFPMYTIRLQWGAQAILNEDTIILAYRKPRGNIASDAAATSGGAGHRSKGRKSMDHKGHSSSSGTPKSLSLSQYENRFKNTDLKLHKLIRRILAITRLNRFVVEHANLRDANFSLWMHGRTSGGLNRAIETDIRRWLVHYDPDQLHALLLRYEALPEMQRSTEAFTADLKKIRVPLAAILEDEFAWPVVGSEEDAEELWTQAVEYCHVKLTTKSGTVRVFGPRKRRDGKRFDDDDGDDDESDGAGGGDGDGDEENGDVGVPTGAVSAPSSSQPRKRARKVKHEADGGGADSGADSDAMGGGDDDRGGGGDDGTGPRKRRRREKRLPMHNPVWRSDLPPPPENLYRSVEERQYNEELRFLFARICQRGQITQTDVMHQLNGKIGFQCGQANVSAWARHRMGVESIQRYNQAVIRWIALYEAQLIPEEVEVWQSIRDKPPVVEVARARQQPQQQQQQHRPMATPVVATTAAVPMDKQASTEPAQAPVAATVAITENSLLARLGATVSSSSLTTSVAAEHTALVVPVVTVKTEKMDADDDISRTSSSSSSRSGDDLMSDDDDNNGDSDALPSLTHPSAEQQQQPKKTTAVAAVAVKTEASVVMVEPLPAVKTTADGDGDGDGDGEGDGEPEFDEIPEFSVKATQQLHRALVAETNRRLMTHLYLEGEAKGVGLTMLMQPVVSKFVRTQAAPSLRQKDLFCYDVQQWLQYSKNLPPTYVPDGHGNYTRELWCSACHRAEHTFQGKRDLYHHLSICKQAPSLGHRVVREHFTRVRRKATAVETASVSRGGGSGGGYGRRQRYVEDDEDIEDDEDDEDDNDGDNGDDDDDVDGGGDGEDDDGGRGASAASQAAAHAARRAAARRLLSLDLSPYDLSPGEILDYEDRLSQGAMEIQMYAFNRTLKYPLCGVCGDAGGSEALIPCARCPCQYHRRCLPRHSGGDADRDGDADADADDDGNGDDALDDDDWCCPVCAQSGAAEAIDASDDVKRSTIRPMTLIFCFFPEYRRWKWGIFLARHRQQTNLGLVRFVREGDSVHEDGNDDDDEANSVQWINLDLSTVLLASTGVRTQRNRRPSTSTPRSRRSSGGGGSQQARRGSGSGSGGGVRMSVDAYARPYLQRNRVRTSFFVAADVAKEGRSARGGTGRAGGGAATASSSSARRNRSTAPSSTGGRVSGGGSNNRRGSRGTTRGSGSGSGGGGGGSRGASSTGRRGSSGDGNGSVPGAKKVAVGSDDIGDGMTDTYISATTMKAALASAGMACKAVDVVVRHANANAFACIRPPGHHAGRHGCTPGCLSTGFCILNNAAIAMVYARVQHGLQRVAVVDFDVHFGNGTADILKGDPNAFFASVHMVYGPKNDGVPAVTTETSSSAAEESTTMQQQQQKKKTKPLPAPQPGTAMGFYPAQLGQTEIHDNFICVGVQPENVSRLLSQRAQQWHSVQAQRKLEKEREALQQMVAATEDIDDQDSDDLVEAGHGPQSNTNTATNSSGSANDDGVLLTKESLATTGTTVTGGGGAAMAEEDAEEDNESDLESMSDDDAAAAPAAASASVGNPTTTVAMETTAMDIDETSTTMPTEFIGSKGFLDALRYVIIPRLEAFAPELLILSAGFDGYKTDPIGGALHLTLEDYTQCTTMLMDAMKRVAQRTEDPARASRVVSLLEGGYDTSPSTLGLAKCVERHVSTLRLKGN